MLMMVIWLLYRFWRMRPRENNMIMQLHIRRRCLYFYSKFTFLLKLGSIAPELFHPCPFTFCWSRTVFSFLDFRCFIILHATIGLTMVTRRWDLLHLQLEAVMDFGYEIDLKWLNFASDTHFVVLLYFFTCQDPRAVLVGLLLILSGFQYLNQSTRYNQVLWNI